MHHRKLRIIKDLDKMRQYSLKKKCHGKSIAFVPTMGYLHEGHLSLVEAARKKCDIVIVSIFVNPIQFGPREDFSRYPRDLKRDKKLLESFDVDILFFPKASDMYLEGAKTRVEVGGLSQKMCGRSRPAHFAGVTTVVTKLFNLVVPDCAFFGEKDFQQLLIIKRLAQDLNLPVKIIGLPTVRDFDGLAMSSRNKYLNTKERKAAAILYRALCLAKDEIENGEKELQRILFRMRALIGTEPSVRLDYIVIADPKTLEDVKKIKGNLLVALAAYIGDNRLIDNILTKAK